ncbi:MAG: hypothetical protein ACE5KO_05725 [Candidatus Bathyarchaeia archaeon]
MTTGTPKDSSEVLASDEMVRLAYQVSSEREHPLLMMFYPNDLYIEEEQIEQLHTLLVSRGLRRSEPLETLDVLIHTYGGDPTASYRLAQVIRNFAKDVHFLVPEYAFSGGTIICLSGEDIMLGDFAVLSPIDITLHRPSDDEDGAEPKFPDEEQTEEVIELVAIDHFIRAAVQARIEVEREFRRRGWQEAKSSVESDMLCQMVEELGVIEIGKFYREKNLTREYANELLTSYMFRGSPSSDSTIQRILRRLIVESPSHAFPMDYHICLDVGLKVMEMEEDLANSSRALTRHMKGMVDQGWICGEEWGVRLPFFELFDYTPTIVPDADAAPSTEAINGDRERVSSAQEREEPSAAREDGTNSG